MVVVWVVVVDMHEVIYHYPQVRLLQFKLVVVVEVMIGQDMVLVVVVVVVLQFFTAEHH